MDRIVKKSKWNKKRIMIIISGAAILFLIITSYYFTSGKSKLNINKEKIIISEIKRDAFQEFIPVNGIVLPRATIYLDAMEGGRVEEKYVEDGAIVKKDQPILRLSNTDLELSLANQETAVFQVLTQMQNTRNNSEQNTIRQLNQMAEVNNAFTEAERVYTLNKTLYEQKVIAGQEFKSSENNYNYQVNRKKLTEQTLQKDKTSTRQELAQMAESYARMKNALALMRKKVGDLVVRAPIDGQLTALDVEIGQSKNKGERLGQIDITDGFKIRADIDETYISRIFAGLQATCSIDEKTYRLEVKKIYTQVTNGRFQIDMEFVGDPPKNIRRGQGLSLKLALSNEAQALLLPKGGFYQQTAGNWIFKLNEKGSRAYKVDMQVGRQNPDYFEVLQGLRAGDKVITSGYDNYGNIEEIILNK